MSLVRFPLEQYASLELNQVGFSKTGMVVSQTPLGTYFTKENPCENGMWVSADKSKGVMIVIIFFLCSINNAYRAYVLCIC